MLLNPYRFQSGSAGLWTPLNMATVPQIYLDAAASTITQSGGVISAVSNLGSLGSSGDFVQSISSQQPAFLGSAVNGLPVISFDGSDDALECNTSVAKALFQSVAFGWSFLVYKKRTADASPRRRTMVCVFAGPSSGVRYMVTAGYNTAGNADKPNWLGKRQDGDGVNVIPVAGSAVQGSYVSLGCAVSYGGGTMLSHLNGSQTFSGSASTAGNTSNTAAAFPLAIGATVAGSPSDAADIDLAAVVIGNFNLTTTERQKLEGWAAHKYGLTASLPSGHPYKTTAPTI